MKKIAEIYTEINKGKIKAIIQLHGFFNGTYKIVSVNPRNWTITIKPITGRGNYLTIPVSPELPAYILQ